MLKASRRKFLKAASGLFIPAMPGIILPAQAQWSGCSEGFCNPPIGGSSTPNWASVQSFKTTSPTTSPFNAAFSAPVTPGNIVVGSFICTAGSLVTSITDDKSNSYQIINQDGSQEGGGLSTVGFRSQGGLTNGPQTITVTLSSAPALVWLVMDEFTAGFALGSDLALDGSQLAINDASGTMQPYTTAFANNLLYCGVFSTSSSTPGSGWTATQGSGSQQMAIWKQGSSAGNVTPAFTTSGTIWNSAFGVRAVARNNWQLRQNALQRSGNNVSAGGTATSPLNMVMASGSIGLGVVALGTTGNGDADIANLTSIVDDKGHTWPIIRSAFDGRSFFWSNGAVSWAPQTLTITVNHTEIIVYSLLTEFIPPPGKTVFTVESLSGDGVVATGGSLPFTVGPITPTQDGDLIYAMMDNSSLGSKVTTGFSMINGQRMSWCDSYLNQYTAAAVSVQYTGGGTGGPDQGIIAIKAS